MIFIISISNIKYKLPIPSIAKVTSSLRGVPFLINTPDVSSSISVWKGPKAFVNPSLGYQIFPLSEESSTFNDVTSFKSLKSILRSFLFWNSLLAIYFANCFNKISTGINYITIEGLDKNRRWTLSLLYRCLERRWLICWDRLLRRWICLLLEWAPLRNWIQTWDSHNWFHRIYLGNQFQCCTCPFKNKKYVWLNSRTLKFADV